MSEKPKTSELYEPKHHNDVQSPMDPIESSGESVDDDKSPYKHVERVTTADKFSKQPGDSENGLEDDQELPVSASVLLGRWTINTNIEFKWTTKRILSLVAMAFLWTGSQIPVYLLGGIPPLIYADLGGLDRWTWFVLANLLSLAAVCPFVGSLSDIMGRRYVALLGSTFLVIAMIICGTANNMNQFIGKRSLQRLLIQS